jgi:transcriptional regulator of acetoin/glycerol metabolism
MASTAPGLRQQELWRAQAVAARGAAWPPGALPPEEILDSWVRCRHAGLDAAAAPAVPVVEAGDLARRRERIAVARRLAQAELHTLAPQIAGSNFLLAFADREGVILDCFADNRFSMSGEGSAIRVGSFWSEGIAGTNGLGTALALGRPVAVTGPEHYFHRLGEVSCTAAPVRDSAGSVVGVLDASSYFESRQLHTLALVQMAAAHIEAGLFAHETAGHWLLALHPRREFLDTLSAGLVAFDAGGTLVALSQRARQLLAGLDAVPGVRCEALFSIRFEELVAALWGASDVRLCDTLGSALHARCRSRPPRERDVAAVTAATVNGAAAKAAAMAAGGAGRAGSPAPAPVAEAGAGAAPAAPAASPPGAMPAAPATPPLRAAVDRTLAEARRLALGAVRLRAPVVVQGEAGSGKELLARWAHAAAGRGGAFVAVAAAALGPEAFELPDAAGALHGVPDAALPLRAVPDATRPLRGVLDATRALRGVLDAAEGGTLLLDEVGELPPPTQAALLRWLDDPDREPALRPGNGAPPRRPDVLLIATTTADLGRAVAERRFRADLLYRLDTVPVRVPALRERQDFDDAVREVLALVDARAAIDAGALARLKAHRWPGNFRELRAVLTRALLARAAAPETAGPLAVADIDRVMPAAPAAEGRASGLRQQADLLVQREVEAAGGSVSAAARALGISRTTIYRHLRGVARRPG